MGTLYDLLGALPNDDAEGLRIAFRRAAKATHPDLNPDNPEAARLFRELVRAHDILSDTEQRATYDRLLTIATEPPPQTSRQLYERVHRLASSTIAATIIAAILVSGYTLIGMISPPVAAESTVGFAARTAIPTAAPSGRADRRVALDDIVFSTGAIARGTRASRAAADGPVLLASLGTSKPAMLSDLQHDLPFLPLYSTPDVRRAFAGMERARLRVKARQARTASVQTHSTARVLDAPPVIRPTRVTRMTQAITP